MDLRRLQRNEDLCMLVVSVLVGLVAGLITAVFTDIFVASERFRYAFIESNPPLFLITSLSLTLITAYSLKKLLGGFYGSSTSYVVKSYHVRMGHVETKDVAVYTLGSISSVLAGAVVGPEGPGIAIGAFVGYWLSRYFGCKGELLRKMTLVGGAAGVASVFRAPLTAMAFAIEVPYKKSIESGIFLPALLATLTSYLVTVLIAGPQRLLLKSRPFKPPFPSVPLLLLSIGLGITAALLTYIMYFIKHHSMEISEKVARRRYWYIAPITLALLVFLAGTLLSPLIPGAGDVLTERVFNEPESLNRYKLLEIVVAKAALLPLSMTFGTTGGLFMPLVSIGSALGLLYVKVFNPGLEHIEPLILAGVSALFAASMKTLLTSILIGVEFLGFGAFFTSTVAASVAYLLTLNISLVGGQLPSVQDVKKRVIIELYDIISRRPKAKAKLSRPVEAVTNKNVIRLTKNMTVGEAIEIIGKEPHTYYPVVDVDERLVGEVSLDILIAEEDPRRRVGDLAYWPQVVVYYKVPIDYALRLMIDKNSDHAIVIDEKTKVVGMVTRADVLKYLITVAEED